MTEEEAEKIKRYVRMMWTDARMLDPELSTRVGREIEELIIGGRRNNETSSD